MLQVDLRRNPPVATATTVWRGVITPTLPVNVSQAFFTTPNVT